MTKKTEEGWSSKELREGLEKELKTMIRLINMVNPESEEELIAIALPNLNLFVHEFVSLALQAREEEIRGMVEEIKKEAFERSQHDLKGRCDFERVNTCNKILSKLTAKK